MVEKKSCDFLIIGAGVIGLAIARNLRTKHPSASIGILEKESKLGAHSSGRNSGVIHAGFYYSADSLKAKFTRQGNIKLTSYCDERNIRLNKCGKLVVARNAQEHEMLFELYKRGEKNGVPVSMISATEACEIEPRVKTFEHALWSPTTASVNPVEVLRSFEQELKADNVAFYLDSAFIRPTDDGCETSSGNIKASHIINCAGLYADKIAHMYDVGKEYTILPFKGLYLYSSENIGAFRTNIYPVPNLKNPFLGVHFTLTSDGHIKIGPTAIPAFWRENYHGFSRFSASEFASVASWQSRLFFRGGFDFRGLALEECQKIFKRKLVKDASTLATGVNLEQYRTWGKPGIRAQLLNRTTKTLEMDFVVKSGPRSTHVLNAVSPAFTCSLAFADHVVENFLPI